MSYERFDRKGKQSWKLLLKQRAYLLTLFLKNTCAGLFMTLQTQYLYQRVTQNILRVNGTVFNNNSSSHSLNTSLYTNNGGPPDSCQENTSSLAQTAISQESAMWNMYFALASGIPGILTVIILGILSDRIGRRFLFLWNIACSTLKGVILSTTISLDLDISLLVCAELVEGLSAGFNGMLLVSFAYTSDIHRAHHQAQGEINSDVIFKVNVRSEDSKSAEPAYPQVLYSADVHIKTLDTAVRSKMKHKSDIGTSETTVGAESQSEFKQNSNSEHTTEADPAAVTGAACSLISFDDVSSCRVEDLSSCKVQDVSSCRIEDVSSCRIEDVSSCKVEDESSCKVEDVSSCKVEDESSCKVEDESSCKVEDVSSCKVEDESSCKVEDESRSQIEEKELDVSREKKRTLWIVITNCLSTASVGFIQFATGYFVDSTGFFYPTLVGTLVLIFDLFFTYYVIEETHSLRDKRKSLVEPLKIVLSALNDSNKRRSFILCNVALLFIVFCDGGLDRTLAIFEMSPPFCWSAVLIGWFNSTYNFCDILSVPCLLILRRFSLSESSMAGIGTLSYVAGSLLFVVSTTTWLMFMNPILTTPGMLAYSLTRSITTRLVGPKAYGSAFALIAAVEMICSLIGALTGSSLYRLTVAKLRSATFVLFAVVYLVSAILYFLEAYAEWRRSVVRVKMVTETPATDKEIPATDKETLATNKKIPSHK